jgi:hypothetical protein
MEKGYTRLEGEMQQEVAVPYPTNEYRPSNKEALCEYEVNIRFLNRGCVVKVGCKEIAFESIENAMAEINAYVANPWEEGKKWRQLLD